MKKITDFKAKGDQTNGNLDRVNELNMLFSISSSQYEAFQDPVQFAYHP